MEPEQIPTAEFLHVPMLLEASEPRPRAAWIWYVVVAVGVMLLVGSAAGRQGNGADKVFGGMALLLISLVLVGFPAISYFAVRAVRGEQRQVEGIGELLQLRRWPQAALLLENYLSRPARSAHLRTQALVYLGIILSRFHRFDDSIAIIGYLIDKELVDPGTAYGLRLGRVMAMLHEDHLFDADRAISELRRMTAGADSAGLALVEIYRDVKTGHPDDAISIFHRTLPVLRDQLGHRLADAYALIARAFDMQGRQADAADAFGKATALAPWLELVRRYPEVQKMVGRYQPFSAPPEAM